MPAYSEQKHQPALLKLEKDQSYISARGRNDWIPKFSQVKASERLRFPNFSDNFSGGIQYWCKQKQTGYTRSYTGKCNALSKMANIRVSQHPRCEKCGGFMNEQAKIRLYLTEKPVYQKCMFGREYCDVVGPCSDCTLLSQRNAIVDRQALEFPELEVTPRRLVAPYLARTMLMQAGMKTNYTASEYYGPGHSILELPPISPNTLQYMRKETGSTKQRRNCAPQQQQTIKKYIEIRLPKI